MKKRVFKVLPTGRPCGPPRRDAPEWSQRLRELRMSKNINMRQLSAMSGVNYRQIQRFEAGDARPGLAAARRLVRALLGESGRVEDVFHGID